MNSRSPRTFCLLLLRLTHLAESCGALDIHLLRLLQLRHHLAILLNHKVLCGPYILHSGLDSLQVITQSVQIADCTVQLFLLQAHVP